MNLTKRLPAAAIATAALVLIGLVGASPATAAPRAAPTPAYELTATQLAEAKALIAATSPTSESFDSSEALAAGVSEQAVADYRAVLESEGWAVAPSTSKLQASPSAAAAQIIEVAAACKGTSGYRGSFPIIGFQFALNSCQTAQLIASVNLILAGGSTAAGVALLTGVGMPASAIIGVLLALVGLGSAFLSACQAFSSNGAIYVNSGSGIPPSCWGR